MSRAYATFTASGMALLDWSFSRGGAGTALLMFALMLALPPCPASAQTGARDDRPMRVILPVGPGSGVDTIIRAVAPSFGKALGQPVVKKIGISVE